jgi:hypothetical protein
MYMKQSVRPSSSAAGTTPLVTEKTRSATTISTKGLRLEVAKTPGRADSDEEGHQ